MSAIHNTQRAITAAKHERKVRADLHGRDSASYQRAAAEVKVLQEELRMIKREMAERRGLQVVGGAA